MGFETGAEWVLGHNAALAVDADDKGRCWTAGRFRIEPNCQPQMTLDFEGMTAAMPYRVSIKIPHAILAGPHKHTGLLEAC